MKLSNNMYDFLKDLALIYLPALAVLIMAVFGIWGIPYGEQISATIVAIDTFIGACLKISTNKYNEENGGANNG